MELDLRFGPRLCQIIFSVSITDEPHDIAGSGNRVFQIIGLLKRFLLDCRFYFCHIFNFYNKNESQGILYACR